MGTVFSFDVRDPGDWAAPVAEAVAWLHRVDAVFSTYRDDSDVSRLRRGEVALRDCDPLVTEVLGLCAEVQAESGGAFSARWRGGLDPTGLVKGWAVERASDLLRAAGSEHHCVNGGGDVQLAGEALQPGQPGRPGEPWRVGIADPHDRARVLAVVRGRDCAVATSGTAERGAHIVDPFTGRPAGALAAVTVVGPSLTRVDAYATAAFVLGTGGLAWVAARPGYEALTVGLAGEVATTPGFPRG